MTNIVKEYRHKRCLKNENWRVNCISKDTGAQLSYRFRSELFANTGEYNVTETNWVILGVLSVKTETFDSCKFCLNYITTIK